MPTSNVILKDGSVNFSGGVDSVKVTTIASEANPGGLLRNQLAWMNNATVRDGGILQRTGWQYLGRVHDGNVLYQGGWMYEPDIGDPYLLLAIGGEIQRVYPDAVADDDKLSSGPGLSNSPANTQSFFTQAEQFAVIQAGDYVTLPLFWDGATLRRSIGITNPAIPAPAPGVNEIPAAGPMDYYMNRLWYAVGRAYYAGDIVKSHNSGTVGAQWRDSVLNVTESPLCFGGDGFTVPDNAGSIRALFHNANINTTLGQGQLLIGTRKAVYALDVPVSRTNWIAVDSDNIPRQTVVQLVNGPVNDRSVVRVNGDVFYQSLEPGIRSLEASVRYFQQWGNRSISSNVWRALQFNDRSLMRFGTGIEFGNRLYQGMLPVQTPVGVAHQGIVSLDFIPVSSFGASHPPVWEGIYEGLNILQLFEGDFGGRQRAFAVTYNAADGGMDLWELTDYLRTDVNASGESRVSWRVEWPAFTFDTPMDLKKLVSAELWIDKMIGTVHFIVEYRPDGDVCWHPWYEWEMCSAKNSTEDVSNPDAYPVEEFRESFRSTVTLPLPPQECQNVSKRPVYIGRQFQPRITVKGWCRIRGILLHAEPVVEKLWDSIPPLPVATT